MTSTRAVAEGRIGRHEDLNHIAADARLPGSAERTEPHLPTIDGPVPAPPMQANGERGWRITDLPVDQRPRERLQRLGPDVLTDAEVVAVLLGSGRPGTNAVDLATELLGRVGGIAGITTAGADALRTVPGVGPTAVARILAAAELARRSSRSTRPSGVTSTADIAALVVPELRDRDRERVVVAVFDRRLRVRGVVTVADGGRGHASMPVTEILRAVLAKGGDAFAVAHNHPGGTVEPSDADRKATAAIRQAAEACALRFLDHLVVSGEKWAAIER